MATFDAGSIQAHNPELDTFIPTLWSNELVASTESNIVLGGLVTNFNHRGRKGDVIQIPRPIRGAASAMTEGSGVTLINNTESSVSLNIDKYYEYSRLVSDLAEAQAISTYRNFYMQDAGHALATQIDTDLHTLGATLIDPITYSNGAGSSYSKAVIGSDGTTFWDGSANTNTGNGAVLSDAGIRHIVRLLDDMNAPQNDRFWVIPPVEKENLLGLSRFTEQAFVGESGAGNSIRSGRIGSLYGADVYVSSNCATVTADDTTTDYRVGLYFHRSAFALVTQVAPNMEVARMAQFKAYLLSADTVYGVGSLSTYLTTGSTALDMAIAFVVPA